MHADGAPPRSLVYHPEKCCVAVIDQTLLPLELRYVELHSVADFQRAIITMQVRGAPLIGVAAAYGLALAVQRDPTPTNIEKTAALLRGARPTAVNLHWALQRVERATLAASPEQRGSVALQMAQAIATENIAEGNAIGVNGLELLRTVHDQKPGATLQVLTHCNAGWLVAMQWGTALAPLYLAHQQGLPIHVWVSETRPRNQGMLTAWELAQAGIRHTLVTDSAAGHLMQSGMVDCCIVGSDRTAANGDVCNKVGTYPKALVARDCGVPFYVALPLSTIDWSCSDGSQVPIEARDSNEVLSVSGSNASGQRASVQLGDAGLQAFNPAFDVTPARLVTALITECGVVAATQQALAALQGQQRN